MMLSIILCQRPITIIHSDNRESRMLVAELNRDWAKYDFPFQKYCLEIQKQYKDRIKFIDVQDYKNARYKLDKYPGIIYGSGEPYFLDEIAFGFNTFPIFAFHTYISNIEADLRPYREYILNYDDKYRTKIEKHIRDKYPKRFEEFMQKSFTFEYAPGYGFPDLDTIMIEFKDIKLPPRDRHPESPIKFNPWDRGFLEELKSGKFCKSVLKG